MGKHIFQQMLCTALSGVSIIDRLKILWYVFVQILERVVNGSFALNLQVFSGKIRILNSIFYFRAHSKDISHLTCCYEPEITNKILSFASSSSGVFIDVGAHIGRYTVLAAKRLGSHGKVLAFEPNPETFKALQRNVELNSLDNVILFNLALGDRNTTMGVREYWGSLGML